MKCVYCQSQRLDKTHTLKTLTIWWCWNCGRHSYEIHVIVKPEQLNQIMRYIESGVL